MTTREENDLLSHTGRGTPMGDLFRRFWFPALLSREFEAMGYRRAMMPKSDFPKLPHDLLTLDFSGWTVFCHAETAENVVTAICAALEARKIANLASMRPQSRRPDRESKRPYRPRPQSTLFGEPEATP